MLLARTWAAADAEGRALLERVIGRADASEQEISAVHQLMRSSGAVGSVAREVRRRALTLAL